MTSDTANPPSSVEQDGNFFGWELKYWRRKLGVSQTELARSAGVSGKHISSLETGRARPSRDMVGSLVLALNLRRRASNALFLAAGYLPEIDTHIPAHIDETVDDPMITQAMSLSVAAYDPFPAFIVSRGWNIVEVNRAAEMLFERIAPGRLANFIQSLALPGPFRDAVENWPAVANGCMALLQRQSTHWGLVADFYGPGDDVVDQLKAAEFIAEAWDQPLQEIQLRIDGRSVAFCCAFESSSILRAAATDLVAVYFLPKDDANEEIFHELFLAPAA